jgi:hypothetical protein
MHSSTADAKTATCVVYDKKTGGILHIHQLISMPGAKPRSMEALHARALELAGKMTGKKMTELAALSVQHEQLKPDRLYRVDTKRRVIIEAPAAKEGRTSSPRARPATSRS